MCAAEAPFEQPLADLRRRIGELEDFPEGAGRGREIGRLRKELEKSTREVYGKLSRWDKTLVARHSDRPYTNDYIGHLMTDWLEVHGDRGFADDPAIVAGFATFNGRSVAVIGHQKGRSTQQRIARNFGQPQPEGYRKALRVMKLAERFGLAILTFIDTPGAYPGIGAEERGQAEAIARNLIEMAGLRVPLVATITGEGGSGGALALGVGNRVLMLEYSIYSVISPEGCAAILWKDQAKREQAAEAMRISAPDLEKFGIVDEVVPEPLGGAHTDAPETCRRVGEAVQRALDALTGLTAEELVAQRYERFRSLGVFTGG
ncbi:MAG: acetyl-CoA carboxylase carboxyltransferase subunit alpha [Acidobacteriota bacterium]|nr:acetyl-CoA carboxylase carboxyltransferase subunit alpha [Acidobacteriota bacterium]MDH3525310.1 acetyl-CoA carboxylase carboxyltransferase subunit alpha [Acidobacteriota bacterium]